MARAQKPLTPESLHDEVRFLLKTLLRDDVFPDEIKLPEAERLLDNSLAIGLADHCAFLKRHGFVDVDRARNVVVVLPRGRTFAEGNADPSLTPALAAHFAARLSPSASSTPSTTATTAASTAATPLAPGGAVSVPPPSLGLGAGLSTALVGDGRARPADRNERPAPRSIFAAERERYVRGDVIGQGSLGSVFVGRDATLDRDVVIKEVRHVYDLVTYLPRDEITTRVKTAVMAQARLDHPHVLRVVDVNFGGEAPTVILDRALDSLAARVQRGLLPVDVVVRVVLQTCYGLAAAHKQGLVHGGLKPENVLFDAAGNVRLADFGIARVAERTSDLQTSAPPVYVGRGHPSYMAPEQLHKGKVLPAGDVYALGILLYEMLTGNLPGRRSPMPSSSERVVRAVGEQRVAALDDLFDRMTRDPLHERFSSVDDVLEGIYSAFPAAQVGTRGTLLLSENDPLAPTVAVDAAHAAGAASDTSEPHPDVTAITVAPPELRD